MITVNNFDICSGNFSQPFGILNEVGDCNEYASEAEDILGLEYEDEDLGVWADIMFSTSTGKQYAVCGDVLPTESGGTFYFKELEESEYLECGAKYLDAFGPKVEEELEDLNDDDVEFHEHVYKDGTVDLKITYKGEKPIVEDSCDDLICFEDLFEGFRIASGDERIAAYLIGCRHRYWTDEDVVLYWR